MVKKKVPSTCSKDLSPAKTIHLWDVAKIHKQSQRESYSHRKHTKATAVEGNNPIATKTKIIEPRILAAVHTTMILIVKNLLINIYPAFHPAQYK